LKFGIDTKRKLCQEVFGRHVAAQVSFAAIDILFKCFEVGRQFEFTFSRARFMNGIFAVEYFFSRDRVEEIIHLST
jgi:hypothetical protein